ncbi:TonB family protein [Hypnocyclicus thermotrophus]|uniref:TonB family protein n=1 Tax=Hypnocyclicus thermotrophus TaxID=1627895 RepID=A0AA46DZ64_9FUSO|nr:TonB family protein [Hypnocyclicus thermotrophus]TDT71493.1 TonB family protein [Hypnocyclicus thermotrophus]
MYYEKTNNNLFYIVLVFSMVIHLLGIIFLPGFREKEIEKDQEIKTIKAGIISIKDDTKKKSTVPKKIIEKKKIAPPKITKIEKKLEKSPKKKENSKENLKKIPVISVKRKSKRNIDDIKILSTNVDGALTTRKINVEIPTTSVDDTINRDIVVLEKESTQEKVKMIEDLKLDVKAKEVDYINTNTKNIGTKFDINDRVIDTENILELDGTEEEIAMPKNITSQVLEGNGRAIWYEGNELPKYPRKAELKGLNGNVTVIFTVKGAKTIYEGIERKSGESEIDRAVEKVARDWKISIESDNGILVDGKVKIKVDFNF